MAALTDQQTYAAVRDEFEAEVRPLVAAGAEVIIRRAACR